MILQVLIKLAYSTSSISCGTTWHSAGLISCVKNSASEIDITSYSRNFYKTLEEEGHATGASFDLRIERFF